MDEFDYINKYICPLDKKNFIGDDAAIVNLKGTLVITKDVLVEKIHFLENTNPRLLAKKSLRVNISDIAAMGATPYGYFLGIILPNTVLETWWKNFALGLSEDNEKYNISLLGGDTSSNTDNTIIISITAIGTKNNSILYRKGAKIGDIIYVSGTIGDAALGLLSYKNLIEDNDYLRSRYDLPTPQIALSSEINKIATSCIDISDGLIQDIEQLCIKSKVGANVYLNKIPISKAAQSLKISKSTLIERVLTGGDDYELLFTIPEKKEYAIKEISKKLNIEVTKIGHIIHGNKVKVFDVNNYVVDLQSKGFKHFSK